LLSTPHDILQRFLSFKPRRKGHTLIIDEFFCHRDLTFGDELSLKNLAINHRIFTGIYTVYALLQKSGAITRKDVEKPKNSVNITGILRKQSSMVHGIHMSF
jgi:hypothetical protein